MPYRSVIGPLILVALGVIFLLNNIVPDLPLLQFVADYWPFLLVAWGGVRFLEVLALYFSGRPLPRYGISGGEWVLAIFLMLAGSALFVGHRFGERFGNTRLTMGGLEIFGDSFDFPIEARVQAGSAPRIYVENLRGNVTLVGADIEQIVATGRTSVRAFNKPDADEAFGRSPLEIVEEGGRYVVRTNHERSSVSARISSDVDIMVPRNAVIETSGRSGDFDISNVNGAVTVRGSDAGIRMENIGGDILIDAGRSDFVRVANARGQVEVRGGGLDIEIENVAGQVTLRPTNMGLLLLRNLSSPLNVDTGQTEVQAERIDGEVRVTRGELEADGLTGPIYVRGRSKDVRIVNFSNSVDIDVNRGDVEIQPAAGALSSWNVVTGAGNLEESLPDDARFEVRASVDRGEIDNDFKSLRLDSTGRGYTLSGSTGPGPLLRLETNRGVIRLRSRPASSFAPGTPVAGRKILRTLPELKIQETNEPPRLFARSRRVRRLQAR